MSPKLSQGVTSVSDLDSINALSLEEINSKPWKYLGYEEYSSFISSDDDFFVVRRFSALTARIILALQDQLSELEEQLGQLEQNLKRCDSPAVHNGSFREETQGARADLVWEINKKLREYNELILQHSQLRTRPAVPAKDISSLRNWHHNNPTAIHAQEITYIDHASDLMGLNPKPGKTRLREFLERSQHFRLHRWWAKKPRDASQDRIHYRDPDVHYISDKRIERMVTLVVTSVGIMMLVAPLWILAFVQDQVRRLGVITVFVVVFMLLISLATVAKPFESLAATAAYLAVLVVFLQIPA